MSTPKNPTPDNPTVSLSSSTTSGVTLDQNVKAHIDSSVERISEFTAMKYVVVALSGGVLFVMGVVFNALYGLNGQSSKNEGQLIQISSFIETLKFKNEELKKQNENLQKQNVCLSLKRKSAQECIYGD